MIFSINCMKLWNDIHAHAVNFGAYTHTIYLPLPLGFAQWDMWGRNSVPRRVSLEIDFE